MVYQIIFSPTGGTRAVSELLTSAFPQSSVIDLCNPKADGFSMTFTADDLCIFAVPAFEGRVPPVNLRRIRRLTGSNTPCIMLAVYGNRAIDDTLIELEDTLLPLGFIPFAAVSAVAQHSMLPMFGAGRPDDADRDELRAFSQKLKAVYEQDSDKKPVSVPGKRPYIVITLKQTIPSYDCASCTGCGQCASLCPVSAIDQNDPAQVDEALCVHCMRCVKVCPANAKFIPESRVDAIVKAIGHLLAERKANTLYL